MGEVRRDRGLIALIIGFAVIAVAVFGTLLLFKQQQSAQRMVVHTLRVQEQLSTIRSRLQDAETGQRGYLVTRDPVYLQPYFDGRRQLAGDLAALRPMLADNPIQLAAARQLEQCAVARVERLSVGLTQARAGRFDHAAEVVRVGVGKTLMDRCRAIIGAMKAEESRLLTARSEALARWSSWLTLWLIGGAWRVFALAVYATRDARRREVRRGRRKATNIDRALAGTATASGHGGQLLQIIVEGRDVQLVELFLTQGLNRNRYVLQIFAATLGGDNDGCDAALARLPMPPTNAKPRRSDHSMTA